VKRGLRLLAAALVVSAAASWLCPKPALYPEAMTFSRALTDREGQVIHLALTNDGKYRLRTPLLDISPNAIRATLTLEDRHFHEHPGVNPLSMLRALWGVVSGTRQGGGSTLTMQVARLRWQLRTTSIVGKATQVVRALQLERHYTKDELLEAYFNLAPYGGNVEGIGAASLLWCGKAAKDVTLRESAALAVLPQSPTRRKPSVAKENAEHSKAMHRLWQRLAPRSDPLDEGYALLPEAQVPRQVPHLARRLFKEQSQSIIVRSTIDLPKQRLVERTLTKHIEDHRESGIANGCALLVHAPTREVLAYVGSAGFLDNDILGQVDGVMARRSPGSALKPFIYGLAMQQGLIHPRSLVRDGRLTFADYNPENFDREFTGPVPAAEALYRSRNIPAVALTQKLTSPRLYDFLKHAGVAFPKPESHYGLALPLGGAEVSMEELAQLYSLLASDGRTQKLKMGFWFPVPRLSSKQAVLSEEARYLTREMLCSPPGSEVMADPEINWKTGTSHGFRDAWAAGMHGEYVLVVWLGNFNGKANPSLVARQCAAPLLFEMFQRLGLPKRRQGPPAGVEDVELCAVSGQLPTPACQHRTHGGFIPGVSPITPCEIHREILLDTSSGLRVARDDGLRPVKREVWEFWPPDMLEMFRRAGLPRRDPPAYALGEALISAAQTEAAPRIVSPLPKRRYTLIAHDPARQSVPLRADAAAGVRQVFWFAGSQFLGATTPVQPLLWKAKAGTWTLQVLDDQGRRAQCSVTVEVVE